MDNTIHQEVMSSSLDFTRLAQLKENSKGLKGEDNVSKEVSQQFEALFINMMLQSMRKATDRSGLIDSHATRTYEQLFDQEIATKLSQTGSFGIAEAIERQVNRNDSAPQDAPQSLATESFLSLRPESWKREDKSDLRAHLSKREGTE